MHFQADPQFQKLLRGESEIDLEELLLEYARDAYPQLDFAATREALDALGEQARERLEKQPPGAHDADRLRVLSRFLYQTVGFRGNDAEYYEPENSYLNEVVRRRLGIPITLGIVYMAVARRAGMAMFGVGTPGHFVIGRRTEADETWYVDPFTAGRVLDRDGCLTAVEERLGEENVLDESHLRPATNTEIAVRVLRNLKACHVMRDDWRAALPVQRRIAMLEPTVAAEQRDLGLISLRAGDPREALRLLEDYSAGTTEAEQAELERYVKAARRMSAELN
jgi:regulator of sirC expression with transglutaminase-like and TPR domain